MYNHPKVKTMNFKAKKIISDLFDLFSEEPYLLPMHWRTLEEKQNKLINVKDYISGMTDKYAINIHKKYFDLYSFLMPYHDFLKDKLLDCLRLSLKEKNPKKLLINLNSTLKFQTIKNLEIFLQTSRWSFQRNLNRPLMT